MITGNNPYIIIKDQCDTCDKRCENLFYSPMHEHDEEQDLKWRREAEAAIVGPATHMCGNDTRGCFLQMCDDCYPGHFANCSFRIFLNKLLKLEVDEYGLL